MDKIKGGTIGAGWHPDGDIESDEFQKLVEKLLKDKIEEVFFICRKNKMKKIN